MIIALKPIWENDVMNKKSCPEESNGLCCTLQTLQYPILASCFLSGLGLWTLWQQRAYPQAAGHVNCQSWQNMTWQPATDICTVFVIQCTSPLSRYSKPRSWIFFMGSRWWKRDVSKMFVLMTSWICFIYKQNFELVRVSIGCHGTQPRWGRPNI